MSDRIVLASGSPRRRELLAALVPEFEVLVTDVPEPFTEDPARDALELAQQKALAALELRPAAVVIAADTVVAEGGRPFGKPADAAEAVAMWKALRGRTHQVITGVAVGRGEALQAVASTSEVELSPLSDAEVEAYVASGRPMDKAGAYAVQDEDVPTVRALRGCYCSVMGLPLWRLRMLLEGAGVATAAPSETFARCASCPERPTA